MNSQQIATIILSFVLIATFISVFYFTYVASVEGDVVKAQVSYIVDSLVRDLSIALSPAQKTMIRTYITRTIKTPDTTEADAKVESSNQSLFIEAAIIFAILIGVGLIIVGIMRYKYKFDALETFQVSLLMLCVVAATYYAFITFIVKNYNLIDSNYVRYLILSKLQEYGDS